MVRSTGTSDDRHAVPGDARLFVTRRNGKPLAVLYRQKSDRPGNRVVFSSPIGEAVFDDVEDVSDRVTLTASDGALTGATSSTFTVNPAAANKLAFVVQPTSTTAGRTSCRSPITA